MARRKEKAMNKKLPKTLVDHGSTCLVCDNGDCHLMGRGDRYLCEECSTTAFLMFQRSNQLEEISDKVSIKKMAEQGGEYKDANGVCACPACCFNELMDIDPVMNQLKFGGIFRAPDKGTFH
jgi:hypothetical protein